MAEDKKSLAEMRKQLREMRKETVKPVSRMKKADIATEIQKLSGARETTAPVAATPIAPQKKVRSAAESIKEAKASEFPVKPTEQKMTKAPASAKPKKAPAAKKDKLAALLKALESDTDQE